MRRLGEDDRWEAFQQGIDRTRVTPQKIGNWAGKLFDWLLKRPKPLRLLPLLLIPAYGAYVWFFPLGDKLFRILLWCVLAVISVDLLVVALLAMKDGTDVRKRRKAVCMVSTVSLYLLFAAMVAAGIWRLVIKK